MPNDKKTPLRVLILEYRPEDAELLLLELRKSRHQQLLPFYRTYNERFEELGRYLVAPIEA